MAGHRLKKHQLYATMSSNDPQLTDELQLDHESWMVDCFGGFSAQSVQNKVK